jgi:hypothetical protein
VTPRTEDFAYASTNQLRMPAQRGPACPTIPALYPAPRRARTRSVTPLADDHVADITATWWPMGDEILIVAAIRRTRPCRPAPTRAGRPGAVTWRELPGLRSFAPWSDEHLLIPWADNASALLHGGRISLFLDGELWGSGEVPTAPQWRDADHCLIGFADAADLAAGGHPSDGFVALLQAQRAVIAECAVRAGADTHRHRHLT